MTPSESNFKPIQPVTGDYNPYALERSVRQRWEDLGAYELTRRYRADGKDWYIIDGPPYTSGAIHLGTVWNKALKDSIIRYKRMHGFNVRDQAGWDMHGLPIEVKVEKELNFANKQDIEDYGIDRFIAKCREFAIKHREIMTDEFKELGIWLDWERPYQTIENSYIEAAWWTLAQAEQKKLLFQDLRTVIWCPRCETALAEAEIEYWDEEDPSIWVRFPLLDRPGESIVIWTTTPWTLPADLAVAVHPDREYVRIKVWNENEDGNRTDEEILICAAACAEDVARAGRFSGYDVVDSIPGDVLEGMKYKHPLLEEMEYHRTLEGDWIHKVICADYVELDYTGCVHTAPGHGPEDFEIGRQYGIPPFCPIDPAGCFTDDVEGWKGMFHKDADESIMKLLAEKGILLHRDILNHRFGHCWRCKSPITYRVTKQWYLRVTEIKDRMLEEVARVKWTPEWAGSSRQKEWVANARDWCISRQRYWGIPFPIWRCDGCEKRRVIGSLAELVAAGAPVDIELHRPHVDAITMDCDCGGTMRRVEDVLDVWFDSAVCSWAQLNYPGHKADFERWWPCDFIVEAHDQTRGWFYSQLGASVVAFDRIPYDEVLMHGFAMGHDGKPMSKSLGNFTPPLEIISEFGADAMRFYILTVSAQWEDVSFQTEGVKQALKLFNVLWNLYRFATTYMALDNYAPPTDAPGPASLPIEEQWLLSRLESTKRTFTAEFDRWYLHRAGRALEQFVLEDLSRWYVRLVRDRLWEETDAPGKAATYFTLWNALRETALMLAPLTPHIADELYSNLDGGLPTVHMADWSASDEQYINLELESQMALGREMVEACAAAREKLGRKLRWPVARVILQGGPEVAAAAKALEPMLKTQCNAKAVEYSEHWEGLKVEASPNFKALGPTFKGQAKAVAEALRAVDGPALQQALESAGTASLRLPGDGADGDNAGDAGDEDEVTITPEMVQFRSILPESAASSPFSAGTLIVDGALTDELRAEGYARDLVRRIQQMRKDLDLPVEAAVRVSYTAPEAPDLLKQLADWQPYMARETRAEELRVAALENKVAGELVKEWDIEGVKFIIGVARVE